MKKILNVDRPGDYAQYVGAPSRHPHIAVVDFTEVSPIASSLNNYGVYALFMHTKVRDDLTYGSTPYTGADGSLICVAPGQIGGREDQGDLIDLDGWAILFHPDLLIGTSLEKEIRRFSFFDYSANEALRLEEDERRTLTAIVENIRREIDAAHDDTHQKGILVGFLAALLSYCRRFYDRQFSSIRMRGDDILVKFSRLINEYFETGRQFQQGLPTVQFFADQMCMTPGYFSDLMRKSTGESAGNFIRSHLVRMAKNRLVATGNVARVAYDLGFDYPQHFSRMFKKQTGLSPREFLGSNT